MLWLAAGCAEPGRHYVVAPAISGVVSSDEGLSDHAQMLLIVMQRESPNLFDRKQAPVDSDGGFGFDATELVVAGHEFSKHYRVFLHLQSADRDRVIWRADLSRRALAGSIRLDCDLDRPAGHGQPCWVANPMDQPWLIEEGQRNFRRMCAECHGRDGGGDISTIADLHFMPPDLTRIAVRNGGQFDRAKVAEWIEGRSLPAAHGTRVMPVWGDRLSEVFEAYAEGDDLIGATLDPVLAYLESIQQSD
jgi:cytochrome c553